MKTPTSEQITRAASVGITEAALIEIFRIWSIAATDEEFIRLFEVLIEAEIQSKNEIHRKFLID